jgi:hypothetical protein
MTRHLLFRVTEADEWAIHRRATQVIFSQDGHLGNGQYYNPRDLTKHERVSEYAESIAAELIVAKYFGLNYNIEDNKAKRRADVGSGLEVRNTHYDTGALIVYEYDRPEDVAVLVVGKSPIYRIAGWIPVSFARVKRYKHAQQLSWWVTQDNLYPIEDLGRSDYEAVCRDVPAVQGSH